MNESNPLLPPVETAPLPAYKDRSTGLIIFGILTLLLGCLAGLFVPLMLFGQMMAAKAPNAPPVNHAAMLPVIAHLWRAGGGADLAGHRFHPGTALGAGAAAHLFLELAHHGHLS